MEEGEVNSGVLLGINAKLFYPRKQGCAFDAHARRSSIRAAYSTLGFHQHADDLLALLLGILVSKTSLTVHSTDCLLQDPSNIFLSGLSMPALTCYRRSAEF